MGGDLAEDESGGAVTKIDPNTRTVLATYEVDVLEVAIAADEEQVWVVGHSEAPASP